MKKGDLVINDQHGWIGLLLDRRVTETGFVILTIHVNGDTRPYTEHHWRVLNAHNNLRKSAHYQKNRKEQTINPFLPVRHTSPIITAMRRLFETKRAMR